LAVTPAPQTLDQNINFILEEPDRALTQYNRTHAADFAVGVGDMLIAVVLEHKVSVEFGSADANFSSRRLWSQDV
jgi:hypothetical protein